MEMRAAASLGCHCWWARAMPDHYEPACPDSRIVSSCQREETIRMDAARPRQASRSTSRRHRCLSVVALLVACAVLVVGGATTASATQWSTHGSVIPVHASPRGAHGQGSVAISPSVGPTRGGTVVVITGSGLRAAVAVRFGRAGARYKVVSTDDLRAISPAGKGVVAVRVKERSTTVFAGDFRYLSAPTVRSVAPNQGGAQGGTRVLVRGSGFVAGMTVTVGGHRARSVEVRNPRSLLAVVPPGFGTLLVRVATPGGTSHATPSTSFTYESSVLVIGDSLGIDLGWGFVPDSRFLRVTDDSMGSTGLVRQDFYNWPAHLRADLRAVHPTVVIALFGANDDQAIETAHGTYEVGTAAWSAAYKGRIRQLRSIVSASGAYLAWVALPRVAPTADIPQSFVATVIRLGRAAMRGDHKGWWVSTATLFTTATGAYTPLVYLPHHVIEVGHQPDGLHLTPAGATAVDALAVATLVRRINALTS